MDARRTPQRIVNAHPPDQRAQVRVDLRPASKGAGFPTPVMAKAGPMPTHQGLRVDVSRFGHAINTDEVFGTAATLSRPDLSNLPDFQSSPISISARVPTAVIGL